MCSLFTLVNLSEEGDLASSASWNTAQRSPFVRRPQGFRLRSGVVSGKSSRFAMLMKYEESAAKWTAPGRCREMMPPPISALPDDPTGCLSMTQAATPSGVVSVWRNRHS